MRNKVAHRPGSDLSRKDPAELATPRAVAPTPGRLGTFAVLGAVAGGVPFPWLPDALQKRVRGALVQDIAARHGLSLSPEGRAVLAEPAPAKDGSPGMLAYAMRFFSRRLLLRFGPLGMLPPVRACLGTFVLGHLFARYLDSRADPSVRIDATEASAVRLAIDRAMFNVLYVEREAASESFDLPPEDLRDELTQIVDGVLIATAGVPSWLIRRLDASFDDTLASGHG